MQRFLTVGSGRPEVVASFLRGTVCAFLGALLVVVVSPPALAFTDVPDSHPHKDAIEELSGEGIVNGFTDGTFGPERSVRRSQFAKMITLTLVLPVSEEMPLGPFTDLGRDSPESLYPHEYVACAYENGITKGTTPTTFSPYSDITRAQVITMVVRAIEAEFPELLKEPPSTYSGTWGSFSPTHHPYARKAEYNGLLAGLSVSGLDPWQNMPRGEVAQVLSNLLSLLSGSGHKAQVVITSDKSVFLSGDGETYRFQAVVEDPSGEVIDREITWSSGDPSEVSVSASGLATARDDLGSATLTASAPGAEPAVASVMVAPPSADTVLVASKDVISADSSSAVLSLNSRTRTIRAGDTVVSGSEGELFGKVESVRTEEDTLELSLGDTSLAEAFRELDIHITGTPKKAVVTSTRSPSACRTLSSAGIEITGPDIEVRIEEFRPELVYETHWFSTEEFKLLVHTKAPLTLETGTLALSGDTDAAKDFALLSKDMLLPSPLWVGPVSITLELGVDAGLRVEASAEGSVTVSGPTITQTIEGANGVQFTDDGGWQTIAENSASTLTVEPALTRAYAAGFDAELGPYVDIHAGLSASALNIVSVVGADFAYAHSGFSVYLEMASPLDRYEAGYTGPRWGARTELEAGPKLELTGGVADLLDFLGCELPSKEWALYSWSEEFQGSPDPVVTASSPEEKEDAIDLTATVSSGLQPIEGDRVEFVGYKDGASQGTGLAEGSVSGGEATASWTPTEEEEGTYDIVALLYDPVFGSLLLPYASGEAVSVGESVPAPADGWRHTLLEALRPYRTGDHIVLPSTLPSAWHVASADEIRQIMSANDWNDPWTDYSNPTIRPMDMEFEWQERNRHYYYVYFSNGSDLIELVVDIDLDGGLPQGPAGVSVEGDPWYWSSYLRGSNPELMARLSFGGGRYNNVSLAWIGRNYNEEEFLSFAASLQDYGEDWNAPR